MKRPEEHDCAICGRKTRSVTDRCSFCETAYQRGYAVGVKSERAAVVDWLTTKCVAYGEEPRCGDLVDSIERGEHVTPREAEEGKGS